MKISFSVLLFCTCLLCKASTIGGGNVPALPPPTPSTVASRDANSAVWEWTEYEPDPSGQAVPRIHRYVECATGLNFRDPATGQWTPSKTDIALLPDGTAAATNLQCPVYFPADIGAGVIRLMTQGDEQLLNGPAYLDLDDGTNLVIIGTVTNSVGELISSNQVLYPDIFRGSGFQVDLLGTVRRSGYESDLVFRSQIPDPTSLGLGGNARLQLLTEWFGAPEPVQTTSAINPVDGLADTTLRFGSTTIGPGRVFVIGNSASQSSLGPQSIPVHKNWVQTQGRTFLEEEVPYWRISSQLQTLPAISQSPSSNTYLRMVSKKRLLPPVRLVQAGTNTVKLAKASWHRKPGVVLDYATINSNETNQVFQGDTTYYVSGEYNLSGTTTLEGGTVIKMNGSGKLDIDVNGAIVCNTGPYRPAVFTSFNDNATGEPIWGISSGSPAFGDVNTFLNLNPTNVTLHDLRFSYSQYAIEQGAWGSDVATVDVWNCQFKNVGTAVYGYNVGLHNVLLGLCSYAAVVGEGSSMMGENVTADGGAGLVDIGSGPMTVYLTNCLVTGQPLIDPASGSYTLFTNATVCLPTPANPVYQTVGAGSYYLTNNSPYRNAGTTNIDPTLLASLQQKTTYPPSVYSNLTFSIATNFSPQVQRDTDTPDLGYHYDPLDYVFGGVTAQSNLTFTAGTAAGWFQLPGTDGGAGYGIALLNDVNATFNGTVTLPCYFVRYGTVQEGGNGLWKDKGWFAGLEDGGSFDFNNPASVTATFTKFMHLSQDPNHIRDGTSGQPIVIHAKDCEFYGPFGGYNMLGAYTNCLFYRGATGVGTSQTNIYQILINCSLYGGWLNFGHSEGGAPYWYSYVHDCAFDNTTFSIDDPFGTNTTYADYNYNAFDQGAAQLPSEGTNNIVVTNGFSWQSNWLGNFYLPTNSLLMDKGDRTADQIGLYHFTTQTNQTIEANSQVDIGYHYVAVDANGNPLDSNGDGIPDYLQDANGNGIYDYGDLGDWQSTLNLKVLITRPQSGSSLP